MEPINYNDTQMDGGIDRFKDIAESAADEDSSELEEFTESEHTAELPPSTDYPEDDEEEDLIADTKNTRRRQFKPLKRAPLGAVAVLGIGYPLALPETQRLLAQRRSQSKN
jgi:hypothetical protein